MNLGPGNEFDRIRGILARIAEIAGGAEDVSEVGDDCALLAVGGTTLAISIDTEIGRAHV